MTFGFASAGPEVLFTPIWSSTEPETRDTPVLFSRQSAAMPSLCLLAKSKNPSSYHGFSTLRTTRKIDRWKGGIAVKKLACFLMALLLLGTAAIAEESGVTLYEAVYDETLLTGWYQSLYPFPETLLYANEEENQILVLLLSKQDYPDAQSYISEIYESTQEFATATDYTGLVDWDGAQLGAGSMASYMARYEDDAYTERIYAVDYDAQHLLVIWFTMTGEDGVWIDDFTSLFLRDLNIERAQADEWKTGYIRAAQIVDNQVELTIDYVRFHWGEDAFDYTIEDDGQSALQVKIGPEAKVFIPIAADFSESTRRSDATEIVDAINECLAIKADLLFEVAVRDGQIIWMDYCYEV